MDAMPGIGAFRWRRRSRRLQGEEQKGVAGCVGQVDRHATFDRCGELARAPITREVEQAVQECELIIGEISCHRPIVGAPEQCCLLLLMMRTAAPPAAARA